MSDTYPAYLKLPPKDSVIDGSTCYNRECTSYCAWKDKELDGKWLVRTGDMNAKNWIYRLPENGYTEVAAPKAGGHYIGVNPNGQYGHVVWFESLKGKQAVVSEYNWNYSGKFDIRTVNLKDFRWYQKEVATTPKPPAQTIKVGSTVRPTRAVSYDGVKLDKSVLSKNYKVTEVKGNRIVLGGGLNTAFNKKDLKLVTAAKPSTALKVGDYATPIKAVSYNGTSLINGVTKKKYKVTEIKGDRVVLGSGLNTAFKKGNLKKS